MGLDNPEGAGSKIGGAASGIAQILGYGFSAAGIPLGPMLLGGVSMYQHQRDRATQGKTIEYLSSQYPDAPELPILRTMATRGELDPRSAVEYLAAGRQRRAMGTLGKIMEPVSRSAAIPSYSPESFAGASPSDVVPGERQRYDASEFYQDVPTTTEQFTRAGSLRLPGDVAAEVYRLLLGHQGKAEPNVPAEIQRRQRVGAGARALEESGLKPESALISAEAASRGFNVPPPVPFESVVGGVHYRVPRQGQPGTPSATEVLTPDQARARSRYIEYRSAVDALSAQERTSGTPIPTQRWRALVTQYGDVIPRDDPVVRHLDKVDAAAGRDETERRRDERARLAREAQDRRARDRGTGEQRVTKTAPISLTNEQTRQEMNASVAEVAASLTQSGHFTKDTLPYVTHPSGRRIPKTTVLEEAYAAAHPDIRVRIIWDPKSKTFHVAQAWRITEETRTRGRLTGPPGTETETDVEEPVNAQ